MKITVKTAPGGDKYEMEVSDPSILGLKTHIEDPTWCSGSIQEGP